MSPVRRVRVHGYRRDSETVSSLISALLVLATAVVSVGGVLWHVITKYVGEPPLWLWSVLAFMTVGLGGSAIYYLVIRSRREDVERRAREAAVRREQEIHEQKLNELKTVTALATLLELNQEQINEYHRIATDQADRSFRSSQRAMALGLLVVVGCFAAGLYFQGTQAKVFVASIAAVGSALAAFLNRTYLQMYGQTLSQLNRYFEQPVLTGYYLTAERLAQGLSDDPESEMRRRIIGQVLDASARMNNGAPGKARATKTRKKKTSGTSAARPASE